MTVSVARTQSIPSLTWRKARPLLYGALAWVLFLSALGKATIARADLPSEYELKAALLYNFARFTEWPEDAFGSDADPFLIAVVGDDPFGHLLDDAVHGRSINGRPIVLARWRTPEEVKPCHILFIAIADPDELRRVAATQSGRPVLTMSDKPLFANEGGIVGLDLEADRVHMTINMGSLRRSGVQVSSKLLALSRLIENNP